MTAARLLIELAAAGAAATVSDGNLRLHAPASVLTPDRLNQIKAVKPDLLAVLGACGKIVAAPDPAAGSRLRERFDRHVYDLRAIADLFDDRDLSVEDAEREAIIQFVGEGAWV